MKSNFSHKPCHAEKHTFAITDLYHMTCVYCREEDKLSACIETTSSCIHKKKLKICFCVWTRMTWPRISKSTFPSKISFHNSWKTTQLSIMLSNNVPLTVQAIWAQCSVTRISWCSFFSQPTGSFLPVQFLLATYWKLPAVLESIWSLFNSKATSRVPIIIFIALMVLPTTNWRAWPW